MTAGRTTFAEDDCTERRCSDVAQSHTFRTFVDRSATSFYKDCGLIDWSSVSITIYCANVSLDKAQGIADALNAVKLTRPLQVQVSAEIDKNLDEIRIWLMDGKLSTEQREAAQADFPSKGGQAKALILFKQGLQLEPWATDLVAKSSAGPAIGMGVAFGHRDFSVIKNNWMSRLWTKVMKLGGIQYYNSAKELSRAIDASASVQKKVKRVPHVVGFVGSTTFFNPWTHKLLTKFARLLQDLNDEVTDKEIVVVEGGWRDVKGPIDNRGVGYSVSHAFEACGGSSYHIMPIRDDQRWDNVTEQLSDGTFLPLEFGQTLFAGQSNEEREGLLTGACDIMFVLEGGPGAAVQAKSALTVKGLPVVPIVFTGGTASGMFMMPEIKRPLHVDPASWKLLADNSLREEYVRKKNAGELVPPGDDELDTMARAMVTIVKSTMYPLWGVQLWGSRFMSRGDQLTWKIKDLALPSWKLPSHEFVGPMQCAQEAGLEPILELMKLYEASLRRYGRWSETEVQHLKTILRCIFLFMKEYTERNRSKKQQALMKVAYRDAGQKYRRVYTTVTQDVVRDEAEFTDFICLASKVAHAAKQDQKDGKYSSASQQHHRKGMEALFEIYPHACKAAAKLDDFCTGVAKISGCTFLKAPLKKLWRCMEKMVIKYADAEGKIDESAKGLKDIARSAMQGTMKQLHLALEEIDRCEDVQVVRVKNRFDDPPTTGWADCQIMLFFRDDTTRHICEIQLVHPQLMTVRKNMGAHAEYAQLRSAMELLHLFEEPLPKLPVARSMYFCKVTKVYADKIPFVDPLHGMVEPQWASLQAFRQKYANTDLSSLLDSHHQRDVMLKSLICKNCGVRSLASAMGKCQGCSRNLAGKPANTAMCHAFGIQSDDLVDKGVLSIRYQHENIPVLVTDDALSWSPLHFNVMPTTTLIPDWRYLLLNPSKAEALLDQMFLAACEATSSFLHDHRMREFFLSPPISGWPEHIQQVDLERFCRQHVIYGFHWPSPNYQLCMQWIVPPVFPWHWHHIMTRTHLPDNTWFSYEFVREALKEAARGHQGEMIHRILSAEHTDELALALRDLMAKSEDYRKVSIATKQRYRDAQSRLANWDRDDLFECTVVDETTVCQAEDECGWIPTALDMYSVQKEDTKLLGSYRKGAGGADPEARASGEAGGFYSFPKTPEDIDCDSFSFLKPVKKAASKMGCS